MNKQREVVYGFRKEVLLTDKPNKLLFDVVHTEVEEHVDSTFAALMSEDGGESALSDLLHWLNTTFPLSFTEEIFEIDGEKIDPTTVTPRNVDSKADVVIDNIIAKIKDAYKAKEELEDPDSLKWLERNIILEAVDRLWQEHLYAMDGLRSSINLRAYAQKDPLIEYKHEAFAMFESLMQDINQEILTNMFRSAASLSSFENLLASLPQELVHDQIEQFGDAGSEPQVEAAPSEQIQITFVRDIPKVGRNEPCPCGSGKKYKKCCGGNA